VDIPSDWWRGAVIYQVYPRSFCDSNGDGIGDLNGVAARLDYIASLGVDAVWLAPFYLSPMRDFGYDVADYCAVDPVFGTLADFDRLLARAHALGLKVLIDQVWCHTSDRHPWFLDSRSGRASRRADWYVWADPKPDGTPPNNWLSVFGGPAWRWEPRRRQYCLHHFLPEQPQLNLRNDAVVEAVLATARFWLGRGVDGFRLDAVDFLLHDTRLRDNPPHPPPDGVIPARPFALQDHVYDMVQPEVPILLRRIRGVVDEYPGAATLAEVSSQDGALDRVEAYTAGTEHLHMAYTLQVARRPFDRTHLSRLIADSASAERRGWIAWSFSNHDVERAVTRWGGDPPDRGFARLLMGLLLSLRGSACVYQGEELGLPDAKVAFADMRDPFGLAYYPEFRGRDGSRTPMPWRAAAPFAGFSTAKPWLPVAPEHLPLSVDRQEADPGSLLWDWRRFLAWRKAHPALLRGDMAPLDAPDPLIAFRRRSAGETLIIVANTAAAPAAVPAALLSGARPLAAPGVTPEHSAGGVTLPRYGMLFATAG
jgi:alpha-glucosidase